MCIRDRFYCEREVKLVNANIRFEGNNSLVYLSSTPNSQYPLNLQVYHDSVVFFGRDNNMTAPLNINVQAVSYTHLSIIKIIILLILH